MVVTYSLKFTMLAVQKESFVCHNLYAAYAKAGGVFVYQCAV